MNKRRVNIVGQPVFKAGGIMRFEGKVAIVTGASRGIGKAIALALAQEGASVVVAARSETEGCPPGTIHKTVEEIHAFGGNALAVRTDVTQEEEVSEMVRRTLEQYGRIDILVNNAGIELRLPTEEVTTEQWQQVMDVNLKSYFLCARTVGREMIKNRSGKIINIASVSGHSAVPRMAAYSASKAGVLLLTKTLAVEWAKYNINVNSISPGLTETAFVSRLRMQDPETFKAREERIPLRRAAQLEDIAQAVVFLASSASDNITGEDIVIDGGLLAIYAGYV